MESAPLLRRRPSLANPACALVLALLLFACAPRLTSRAPAFRDYEIWAMDQGTNIVHIFDSSLNESGRIDLGARGMRVPHMLEFTSDQKFAFVAAPATGDVAVIRAADRQVVAMLPTGPRTHHAAISPDDRTVIVSVIGAANAPWDGKLVEINLDIANERFTIGRQLILADDPVFVGRKAEFKETGGAVCLAFTSDGRQAYVTLGPGLDEGGTVVLDTRAFRLLEAFPPRELDANCGTILSPDGTQMYLVGGDRGIGVWHAVDTRTRRPVHRGESRGHDAHGSRVTPDGSEYWIVNRVTSNAIVVNPRTMEVMSEIPFVGKTPDIVAMSPDSRFAFFTLRGPNPVTMPHLAVGETPGVAVFDVRTRRQVRLLEPAKGDPKSDFHGIAVRLLR